MSDKKREFANGLYVKEPWPNSPDWVKFRININREQLMPWLQSTETDNGWINLEVKLNLKGELFADVNRGNKGQQAPQPAQPAQPSNPFERLDEDIPF